MPLDINGYNSTFNNFVQFAQQRVNANDAKAVADAKIQQPLGGRKVIAVTQSLTDEVHKWTRTTAEYDVNDRTRALFKAAIVNMFGSEARIPASVKKAMVMDDYNAGKPLTARRILAVKAAIDADGTAAARAKAQAEVREQKQVDAKFGKFASDETKAAALADGFTRAELKNVAKAVNFLRAANPGMSEADAYREVSTPHSKANRLLQYGGNFLKNANNFARGLQLLDDFAAWHKDLCDFAKKNTKGITTNFANADTPTKLNLCSKLVAQGEKNVLGLETFVFRDLAANPKADLSKTGEDLFGVENNAVMRLCANEHDEQASGSLISLPPEKRRVVYAAFDALVGLAKNADEARTRGNARSADKRIRDNLVFIARVVKNSAALEAKMAKGPLTAKDVIKICFPDLKKPANYDFKAINNFTAGFDDVITEKCGDMASSAVMNIIFMTGCTLKEAIDSYKNSKPLPFLPHLASYSFEYKDHRDGGDEQMKADLTRGYNYGRVDANGEKIEGEMLLGDEDYKNTLTFPDGEKIDASSRPEHRAGVDRAAEKVKSLCGKGHTIQANAVGYCLTQSANMPLNRALGNYGIYASEHVVLDYTLSKNDETGAVTIQYSSPKHLPVQFSWTTTVGVDGSCSSTPMVVDPPVKSLDAAGAQAMVADAAKRVGVQLDAKKAARAAELMQRLCTDMPAKNARLLANFVVRLKLTDAAKQREDAVAADTAKSIREWRDFGFGYEPVAALSNAVKDNVSNVIREHMQPAKDKKFTDNIHDTMYQDANRAVYIFNGTVYDHKPSEELIPAFKALVPDPKKQRALSTYLNQLCLETLIFPSNHLPYDSGVEAQKLPGSSALVNRNLATGLYTNAVLDTTGHAITQDLQVSPDGKTATLTQSISADLAAPGSNMDTRINFGQVTLSQRLVINLEPEVPVATEVKIFQEFTDKI